MVIKPGAEGLIFLPYISGERSPVWDENARGVFIGLCSKHARAHLTRAVIEGICFALFDVLNALEETAGSVERIYLSGGVVQSDAWPQLLANITGKKIIVNDAADASALGAAFIGMKAVGILNDLEDVSLFRQELKTFEPDTLEHTVYENYFEVYKSLYDKLKDAFEAISRLPK
jgi:gluconokinase